MNNLLKKMKINDQFTRVRQKQKVFNNIRNNIPHLEDYNMMADLLMLPETKKGFKYLLAVVDLGTNEFDIEPLKTKTAEECTTGLKKIFKRPYLKIPYASLRTDSGQEFSGSFDKFLKNNEVLHKYSLPNRHTQMATVERLNHQLGTLFNGYMNEKELETGEVYREWTDILDLVRKDLNKIRKINVSDTFNIEEYPEFNSTKPSKYKLGDIVHEKLDYPESALGIKQPTANFRTGDYRYSAIPKRINKVLYFNDKPYYRYLLDGIPNASFSEFELIPSKEKETKYKIKEILQRKVIKKIPHYLIWWFNYLKKDATWEPEYKLIEDGLSKWITDFNKKH